MTKDWLKNTWLFLSLWIALGLLYPQAAFALGDYNAARLYTKESFKVNNSIQGEILIEIPVNRFFDRIIDFGEETDYNFGTAFISARKKDMKALDLVKVSLIRPNYTRLEIEDYVLAIIKKSDYSVIINGFIQIKAPWKNGQVYYHKMNIYNTVY